MGLQADREKKLEESGVAAKLAYGEVDEAFRLVLENGISPYSVTAVQMMGMMKMRASKLQEAEAVIGSAIQMRPNDATSWKMRGDCAFMANRFSDAEQHYRKALSLRADSPEILHDLGVSLVSQGKVQDCLHYFQKAIDAAPGRADFHHHFAIMLVLAGQLAAGWDRMQYRLQVPGVVGSFPFPDKYWKGEDLTGKTIVVRSEQGWGDTIMFARYFPLLLAKAKKVYFYGQRALLSFVKNYYPEVSVWPNDAPVPTDLDYHVNIMCFPRLLGLEPPAPQPKKERGNGIGVCWFGSPTHKADHLRSVPIERFARFAEIADKKLYSLGYGYFWKMDNNGIAVADNKPDFLEYCITGKHDWMETALFVQGLDLVITVDTAIAHLAGFLGVECWVLLPYVPDFRWGMSGDTTPWYPSMKLYRQSKLMEWDDVFERVAGDLRERLGK